MKKSVLFIMNNLNCGGAEKALISLLEVLDYNRFDVDLLLFNKEGIFLTNVPNQVTIMKEPPEYAYFDMPIKKAVLNSLKIRRVDIAFNRIMAGFIYKTEKNPIRCQQRVWKYLSRSFGKINKKYDIAIGYLEKNPLYYCVDQVSATKKIGFIHNDYEKLGLDSNIDKKYFQKLDHIVTVSEQCSEVLKRNFPIFEKRVKVMHNIVSPQTIIKLAQDDIKLNTSGIKIVSIGRLHFQKGYEMAIEACKKLISQNYPIKWFVIGEGEERKELELLIDKHNLNDHFFLLGMKENPYPYIKNADIYVQCSRFEGKSIAIDEAKILNKPIVVTNFSTVSDQIINNQTGIIVEMDADAIAKGIQLLIDDLNLRTKLTNHLAKEKLGTESEIHKLYQMFNAG
ncbi:glycosyltransferase [Bacillus sp. AGMB 02131]|uniref:Glycosyltransferase n=1 Tax=Peribacillus faecalis TaxID=2772559 RepID=A0A927CXB7_9BACI|nr:glycosyltransferase [Peribacillus faecalis]MBD3107680.1 glycosyltransferase [Peribacillus faecalis]